MSYLVLARKYRPQNFEQMVGQEHVVKALSNALEQQRLHHAYLFTGTRGVGKTTVSRILAKSLNCQGADGQGGITAHPCGVCQACRDIDAGRFVDYTELDAASNRGVDEVQSLMEQAVYKPVQGRFKVFMIDEVHMLSNTAFNAMLKTLEEPPEYLKFVLATTDPQKVPVTVLSRCLQFNLRPMAPQTIAEHLQHVLAQESVQQDTDSLYLLARAARGSMRDALSLTDQAIAFGNGRLEEATVRHMLGVVDKRYVHDVIAALGQGDGKQVVAIADQLRQEGIAAASLLEDMALVLQQMALYQSIPDQAAAAQQASESDAKRIIELAQQLPADETQLLYSFCLKGREELGLAPDEYSGLVMVLLRLLAFKAPVQSTPRSGTPPSSGGTNTPAGGLTSTGETNAPSVSLASPPTVYTPFLANTASEPESPRVATKVTKLIETAEVREAQVTHPPVVSALSAPSLSESEPSTPTRSERKDALTPEVQHLEFGQQEAEANVLPWENGPETTPVTQGANTLSAAKESFEKAITSAAPVTLLGDELGVVGAVHGAPVQSTVEQASTGSRQFAESVGETAAMPAATVVPSASLPSADTLNSTKSERPAKPAVAGKSLTNATPDDAWWFSLVSDLIDQGKLLAVVRELALQSQLIRRDGAGLLLRIANQTLVEDSWRLKLQETLQNAGIEGTVSLEFGEVQHSPAQQLEAQRLAAYAIAEEIVHGDARVQWLQSHFGAEIVPGSIQPIKIHAAPTGQ